MRQLLLPETGSAICRSSFLARSALIARSLGGINADAYTFVLPLQEGLFMGSVPQEAGEETALLNGKEARPHRQNKREQGRAALPALRGLRE